MDYVQNNIIQTRIALKYDTFENWTSLNPLLLAGEVAFATVEANSEAGFQNQPNVVIKVGDGVNHYNDLKTVSALAADVYSWAKAAVKPEYSADEVKYTGSDFLSNNVAGVIAEIANELNALTGGESGAGSITTQIANAINDLNVDGVNAGVGEVIASVAQTNGKVVVTKKALTKADIPTIDMGQVNGLAKAISDGDSATLTDAKAYADGLASNYDAAGSATTALASAKAYADGLAVNYDAKGAADDALASAKSYADGLAKNYDAVGSAAAAEANAKAHAEQKATAAETAAKAYADGLASNYDAAGTAQAKADNALASAKAYADGLASNYDATGAAAQALTDAKAYADGLAGNYDASGAAAAALEEAKEHAVGLGVLYDKAGDAAQALIDAKSYANSLAGNYDGKGSAATAETNAKAYADSLSVNYDQAGDADKALEAAKKYTDDTTDRKGSAAQALADAKVDAQSRVDTAIGALTVVDTAVQGKFVTAVSEDAGKIFVTREFANAADVILDTETYPATNVAAAIEGLSEAINDAAKGHIVTLTASDSDDYAKVYTLKQGENQVGVINIPKDIVVKSGSVVDGDIVLVLNDENATEIVIPASDLIEYVTSGSAAGDMIVVNVDTDHKVTATITDGTVTKAKLASDVQTSLGLADSALQKNDITTGSANGTIAVEGTDVAVKGLHAIAFDGDVSNLNQAAGTYIVFNCGSASINV